MVQFHSVGWVFWVWVAGVVRGQVWVGLGVGGSLGVKRSTHL